jgi:OPA family glycerol-3-phosphate transporter-like MFS transporter
MQKSQEYKFELRRVANWVPLGLMYAAFYMSRYNLTVTNPALREAFQWTKEQFGIIISLSLAAYGFSVFFNGPLADRIGGKKAILIGCVGALATNLLFALGAWFGVLGWDKAPWMTLFTYLAVVWVINMYFQSYGALSVVKVNAAWFHISERGIFAGLFGAMIQFGRILAVPVGGIILACSSWQWVHIIPAIVLGGIGIYTLIVVKNTPEELGFPRQDDKLAGESDEGPTSLAYIFKKIFANPTMWFFTGAMMATGLIRHSIEQWAPSYFTEIHHVASDSKVYLIAFAGQVIIGIFGAYVLGYISDHYFQSRRGPVTSIAYFMQAILLIIFALVKPGPWVAAILLMVLYFFLNGCHGLIAGTASMDFGGRKAAATAAGMLDGSQYLVGSLTGVGTGWLLDKFGWDAWAWSIVIFALIAGVLMACRWRALPEKAKKDEFINCESCGIQLPLKAEVCPKCGTEVRSNIIRKVALAVKGTYNTAIFAILLVLFPAVISGVKILGEFIDPSTKKPDTMAVLVFAFFGIIIAISALIRQAKAQAELVKTNLTTQYGQINHAALVMSWLSLLMGILVTAYGFYAFLL